jgi:hypothetical protein
VVIEKDAARRVPAGLLAFLTQMKKRIDSSAIARVGVAVHSTMRWTISSKKTSRMMKAAVIRQLKTPK